MALHTLTTRLIGWILVAAVVCVCVFNAVVMIISPKTWFSLPDWISAKGTLRPERYERGTGTLQIRLLGAVALAFMFYLIYSAVKSL